MGAFSIWHFLIIMVIVLVIFGPSRLPTLGKSLGEAIRSFKKGLNDDSIDVTDTSANARLHDSEKDSSTQKTEQKQKDKV